MKTKILKQYVVDAFTDQVFGGNPAAVCVMDEWLPDQDMQKIAAENCLSETAFTVREGNRYLHLRPILVETSGKERTGCPAVIPAAGYFILRRLW